MNQSRTMSLVEAIANVAIGYAISVVATVLIFPAFGYPVTGRHALAISGAFTIVSIARSFALRRVFERIRARPVQ